MAGGFCADGLGLGRPPVGGASIGRRCRRHRYIPDAQHDLLDQFRPGGFVQFGKQRGFQERQLLEPHGVPDDQRELLETNVRRPGVGPDRFPDDVAPLMLQAELQESGFEAQPLGKAVKNGTE
jgi:hypothetical protein